MNIGLMPRYLTRYGAEDFEKAVYKASGLPAQRFGIEKRGVLKEGNFADLVILDRSPLLVDPMEIKDIKVLETIKDGKVIFQRGR